MPYFCRFENVDVSWRSSDTSPQKKYIAVIVLFDPVPLYSVWLLIVSFQLATYLQHQKSVFPFADEIFWGLKICLTWFVPFCLVILECFCSSIALIQLFRIERKENHSNPTSSYVSIKRVIASSNVYVCSICICLALQTLTCPLLPFHTFLPV